MTVLPCKVLGFRMESTSRFLTAAPLGLSHLLVISKHTGKYQNLIRNPKLQLLGAGVKLQSNDRSYRNMVVCSGVGPGPSIPSDPNPGSWKLWLLGMVMSMILPFWRGKWGPILKLKRKKVTEISEEVETVIDTVEAVTDVVEKVAEQVEKVVDEIGHHLPEGKLKDAFEFVEDIAEETAEQAHKAGELIDKVEDVVENVEDEVECLLHGNGEEEEAAKDTKEEANQGASASVRKSSTENSVDDSPAAPNTIQA